MLPAIRIVSFHLRSRVFAGSVAGAWHCEPTAPPMKKSTLRFHSTPTLLASFLGFVLGFLLCPTPTVYAQNLTWTGTSNSTWNTTTNWSPNGTPANGGNFTFNSTITNQPSNNNITSLSIGSLTFGTANTNGVTIGGSAFTLAGNLTNLNTTASRNVTISNDITISGNQTWTASNSNAITILSGNLLGAGNVTITAFASNGVTAPVFRLLGGNNSGWTGGINFSSDSGLLLSSAQAMTDGLINLNNGGNANIWLTGGAEAGTYTFGIANTQNSGARVQFRGSGSGGIFLTGGDVYWNPGGAQDYSWSATGSSSNATIIDFSGSNNTTPRMLYLGNASGNFSISGGNKTFRNATGGNNPARVTLLSALGGNGTTSQTLTTSLGLLVLTKNAVSGTGSGGAGKLALTVSGGATAINDLNQLPGGNLNLSGGVLILDNISWDSLISNRTIGSADGQFRITGGGFAARGSNLLIPNNATGGLSASTFNSNFAIGSSAVYSTGNYYGNANVTIALDTTLSAARSITVGSNGLGMASGSQILNRITGNLSGSGSIYTLGASNSNTAGELVLGGANSWTGAPTFLINASLYMNVGNGGLIANNSLVRFESPASLPTGNGGSLAYLSAQQRNSSTAFGFILTGNATGQTYILPTGYKLMIGTQTSSSPATTGLIGSDFGKAILSSSDIVINGNTDASITMNFLTRAGSELTLGTGANSIKLMPTYGFSSTASTTPTTLSDNVSGTRTIIKRGEGTLVLGNLGYTKQDGITSQASLFSWQIGRGTASNAGASAYNDGAVRGLSWDDPSASNSNSLKNFFLSMRGGVYEIDNTSGNGGTFTGNLGLSGSGNLSIGNVSGTSSLGGGGFSAFGGNVVVTLKPIGGVSGGDLTWASTNSGFVQTNDPLMFGSETATAMIQLSNGIALNGAQREIRVYDNINSATDLAFLSGNLTGTGTSGINKTGNGTLQLGATNSYAGATTITAGTLQITSIANGGAVSSLGNSTNAAGNLTFSGGTLEYATSSNGSTDRNFTITSGGSGAIAVTGAGELTISGTSAATNGTFTKSGSGTLILNGNNLHTGTTTLAGGVLEAGNSGALGDGGDITFGGGTLRYTASSSGTDYGSRIKNSTGAISLDTNSQSVTLGALASTNAGGLTKSGSGMLTLSGSNSYTGGTTISAGTLNVTGSIIGTTTVNSGGALLGTGTTGAVTISSGALIGAGSSANSVGTLTVGDLTLSGGGRYTWDISNTAGTPGTDWDLISASSTTITATSGNQFTIYLTGNPSNWSPSTSYSSGWNILSWGSSVTGFDASAFILNAGDFTGTAPTGTWSFSNSAGYLKLVYTAPSSAADWTGGSGNWSSGANWQGGSAPSPGSPTPLVFTGSGGVSTNDNQLSTVSGITFGGTGSYTVNGSAINLSGGITNNSSYAQTVALGVTLSAAQTFAANSGNLIVSGDLNTNGNPLLMDGANTVVISGDMSGAGSLTKNGSGSLTLSGSNSYSGTTTLNAGTLTLQGSLDGTSLDLDGGAFSQVASGSIAGSGSTLTVSGATVTLAGNNSYTGATTLTAGTLNLDGSLTGSDITVSGGTWSQSATGSISGDGNSFTLDGGAATLAGTNSYTGATTVNAGTLTLQGGLAISNSGAVVMANTAGAELLVDAAETIGDLSGGGSLGGGIVIASAQGLTVSQSSATTYSGVLSGGGAFVKDGSGTLTINGTNAFTGGTTISAGNLTLVGGAALADSGSVSIADAAGAVLHISANETIGSLSGGGSTGGNVSIASAQVLTVNQATDGTFAGRLVGSGALTKVGSGTLTLSGANTLSGNISISAGNLTLTGGSALPDTGNVTFSNTAGAVLHIANSETIGSISGGGSTGGNINIQSGQSLTLNQSISYSFNGSISGDGSLVKSGSGTLTLRGNNTFTGTTTVSAGSLALNNSSANNQTLVGNIVVNGGNLTLGAANQMANTLNLSLSSGKVDLSNHAATINSITMTGGTLNRAGQALTLNTNSSFTGGGVALTNTASRITASGNTTFGNTTFTYSGTANATTDTFQLLGNAVVEAGSSVNFTNAAIGNNGRFAMGGSVRTIDVGAGANMTINWLAVGINGGIAKNGSGALTLNAANSFSGKTIVQSGTLAFTIGNASATGAQALGTNTALDLGVAGVSSGLLDYTGTGAATLAKNINALGNGNDTIRNSGTGLLTLSGTLTKNGTTLTLNGGANGIDVTGSIAGSNANSDLVVDGGNVTLSSANTYNGPTIINSGTLTVAHANALGTNATVNVNGGSLLVTADSAVDSKNLTLNSTSTTVAGLAFSGTYNGTAGVLTLSRDSIIDLGTGSVVLHFASIAGLGTYNLDIYNWTGTTLWEGGTGNNVDQIYADGSSLGQSELARISFYSGGLGSNSFVGNGYQFMSGGFANEIIAVPEAETWIAAALLTAAAAITALRRRKSFRFPLHIDAP